MDTEKDMLPEDLNNIVEKAASFLADLFVSEIDDKSINKKKDEPDQS